MVYNGILFHDLRRSAVRNLVRSRVPEKVEMQFTVARRAPVFDRYDIVSQDDVLEAGRKLESYFEEEKGHRKGHTLHQNAAEDSPVN